MGRNKINEDGKITPLAFAQIAGCDKSAVMKAISLGHLEDAVTRNANNHIRIDPEKARANWAKNWADTAKTPPKLREFLRGALGSQTTKARAAVRASDIDWTKLPVSESRQIREAAKARQEQLNLEVRLGNLVNIDDVRSAQFEMVAIFRQAMQQIPPQVSPHLGLTIQQQSYLLGEIEKRLNLLAALEAPDYKLRAK